MNPELEKVLLKVQKPGRYAGGESNRVVKDQEQVDVRFAFASRMCMRWGCPIWE